ncbi:energy transducer TonB family protein [Zunongwangia profunda]|uniref:energy transducer TonB family protein n=1 Tax=Zunongwangia profunda TaxID=398743 RepID=UPI000C522E3B|nr:energy transducer TonB [Zunongwangia profunda]MAC65137.1 energy transducer TonB [Flavobacteriaceae bacterium]MAS70515.1 energy transducer TonB [Zunongwangia sp.]|tara:strand:- start:2476 stop:2853 length:378 start_codon:yes stop_codon:yes gene_type:complete
MKSVLLIASFVIGSITTVAAQQTSPVWPGCEDSKNVKTCFNKKLSKHVRENYKYPKNDAGEYVRGEVTIKFEVDEEGKVNVLNIEGDEPLVNEAAKKMIEKMPKMEPGTFQGEPDAREFTVPFKF